MIRNYKIYTAFLIFIFLITAALIGYSKYYNSSVSSDVNDYLKELYRIERAFIEALPIYADFASPAKEQVLRKHLLLDHLEEAARQGLSPVKDDNEMGILEKKGALVAVGPSRESLYYFYNVRKKYRLLTPLAARGLGLLTERFQENLNKRRALSRVKIALSSALRPLAYQNSLMNRNANATLVSTHSYGASFDIFYDEYYISLPGTKAGSALAEGILKEIRDRYGFLLGAALRRQLKSVLMETLIELQEEGLLYAILEKSQRCYHVTILKRP